MPRAADRRAPGSPPRSRGVWRSAQPRSVRRRAREQRPRLRGVAQPQGRVAPGRDRDHGVRPLGLLGDGRHRLVVRLDRVAGHQVDDGAHPVEPSPEGRIAGVARLGADGGERCRGRVSITAIRREQDLAEPHGVDEAGRQLRPSAEVRDQLVRRPPRSGLHGALERVRERGHLDLAVPAAASDLGGLEALLDDLTGLIAIERERRASPAPPTADRAPPAPSRGSRGARMAASRSRPRAVEHVRADDRSPGGTDPTTSSRSNPPSAGSIAAAEPSMSPSK